VDVPAGAGGGGPADVGTSTAASETDAARQKVTSALRLLDTTQAAGSQLVAAKGDQTNGLWVNVRNTVPVTGTFFQATQPVSGPLTDAQLRATPVPVSGPATVTPAGDDVVVDGRDVVTTAGTRIQMSAQVCKTVSVTAETDNTGIVVVGGATVVAAIATRRGLPLNAGDSVTITVDNVNRLWLDSMVSTDGVTWVALD